MHPPEAAPVHLARLSPALVVLASLAACTPAPRELPAASREAGEPPSAANGPAAANDAAANGPAAANDAAASGPAAAGVEWLEAEELPCPTPTDAELAAVRRAFDAVLSAAHLDEDERAEWREVAAPCKVDGGVLVEAPFSGDKAWLRGELSSEMTQSVWWLRPGRAPTRLEYNELGPYLDVDGDGVPEATLIGHHEPARQVAVWFDGAPPVAAYHRPLFGAGPSGFARVAGHVRWIEAPSDQLLASRARNISFETRAPVEQPAELEPFAALSQPPAASPARIVVRAPRKRLPCRLLDLGISSRPDPGLAAIARGVELDALRLAADREATRIDGVIEVSPGCVTGAGALFRVRYVLAAGLPMYTVAELWHRSPDGVDRLWALATGSAPEESQEYAVATGLELEVADVDGDARPDLVFADWTSDELDGTILQKEGRSYLHHALVGDRIISAGSVAELRTQVRRRLPRPGKGRASVGPPRASP